MRMLRLVMPVMVASAVLASAASAATQQAAKDRFAQDAQGARIVSAPSTAAASTVTGTVSAKKLGVSSNATAGSRRPRGRRPLRGLLGVSNAGTQLRYAQATTDALGQRHVRFDQLAGDVPVYDGAVTVHLARGDALTGFTAGVSRATSGAASQPSVSADQARERRPRPGSRRQARAGAEALRLHRRAVRQPPGHAGLGRRRDLHDAADRKLVFVDAVSGQVADALDRTEFAKNRTIYNANGSTTTGSFARGEGDPATGNRDVDAAYDWTGATYDYYASNFGRDSYDGAGAELVSFVHYGVGYENAFWDGAEMVYGDGFAVNDVTAHELTHAVTERTAGLEYQDQPGALNESISDQAGWDVDPGDSTMGEDLPIGAIRDMRNPGAFGQPATASQYVCTGSDNGGVHTNSGIPNKVYANLVDSLGPQRRRAGPLPRADRLPRPRPRRSPTRGRPSSRRPPTSGSAPRRSATPGRRRASRRPGSLPAESSPDVTRRGRPIARAAARPGASRTDRARRRSHNGARCGAGCQARPRARRMMSRSARWSSGERPASASGGSSRRAARPARTCAPRSVMHQHLHAPVVLGRAALDEAAVLEAVDDPGDVRVVAAQREGELAHRLGLVGVELAQRHDLRRRELELRRDGHEAPLGEVYELEHQRPRLSGRRAPACRARAHRTPMVLICINR